LPETGCPPGALRSRLKKHRARDALGLGGLAAIRTSVSLGTARRRGPRVRLDPWRPARPRACRAYPICAGKKSSRAGGRRQETAYPAPTKSTRAAERWLILSTVMRGQKARSAVFAQRDPRIHDEFQQARVLYSNASSWLAGSSPAMTHMRVNARLEPASDSEARTRNATLPALPCRSRPAARSPAIRSRRNSRARCA
jgi:hypothetical protein